MELTTQQNKVFEKIKAFMQSDASVFILRGYAGTGKTRIAGTVLLSEVAILEKMLRISCMFIYQMESNCHGIVMSIS